MAKECQRTENVDLEKLLSAEKKCAEIISELLEVESSPVRIVSHPLHHLTMSGP